MGEAVVLAKGLYRFYKDERMVPVEGEYKQSIANYMAGRLNKDGSGKRYRTFLTFKQEWYEQDHWAYGKKDGTWYVYRVKMKDGQEMSRTVVGDTGSIRYSDSAMWQRFKDRMYRVEVEPEKTYCAKTIRHEDYGYYFSKEFDGKSLIALMMVKPKMTVEEIKMVIENEGGSVDKDLIIHAKI